MLHGLHEQHLPSKSALCRYTLNLVAVLLLSACGSGGSDSSSSGDSSSSSSSSSGGDQQQSTTSHRAGEDCMECHNAEGADGAERFYVAGTIYSSNGVQTNAEVRLYLSGTNTLTAQLTTDDSGNFYTTQVIDGLSVDGELVTGNDVEVESPNGTRTMPGVISSGACNGCHHNNGGGNGRIVAN